MINIIKKHPPPWVIKYEFEDCPELVSSVVDADGENVFTMETHSGDGDFIFLDADEMFELVGMVNVAYLKSRI